MRGVGLRTIGFAGAMFFGFSASAATIEVESGGVSLNTGAGFKKITSGAPANAGDMVMTSPNGTAYIVYETGCRVKVEPSQTATVSDAAVCQAGVLDTPNMALGIAAVGAVAAGAVLIATSGDDDKGASP